MFTGKETGGGECMSDSSVDLSHWQTQMFFTVFGIESHGCCWQKAKITNYHI